MVQGTLPMKTFRVIDVETTGFPPNAAIIELGFTDLVWEGNSLNIQPTKSMLLNPNVPIQTGAKAIHHIDETDLVCAPHPDTILPFLDDNADYIVAHNAKFEKAFIQSSLPWICTMKCAQQLVLDASSYSNQFLRYHLALPLDRDQASPPHRAGPDTYVTAHLLKALLMRAAQQVPGDFIGQMIKWSNEQQLLKTVSFGKYRGMAWSDVPHDYLRWILTNDRAEEDVRHTARHYLGLTNTPSSPSTPSTPTYTFP